MLSNFSVRDTSKIPLSKEINYFKKSREIETNLEKTFYMKFVNQLENSINLNIDSDDEDNIIYEDSDNEISIYNEEEAAEHLDFNEDNNSVMSQNSNLDGNSINSNNDLMNNPFNNNSLMLNNHNSILNQNTSNLMEGFSYLRSEDLKSYLESFGEGKKEHLNLEYNDFKNFSRKLENVDKWRLTDLDINKDKGNDDINKEKPAKAKKVQILFDFSEDREITEEDFEELFESKESKAKKLREINNQNNINVRRENTKKRNTKKFYNFGMRVYIIFEISFFILEALNYSIIF